MKIQCPKCHQSFDITDSQNHKTTCSFCQHTFDVRPVVDISAGVLYPANAPSALPQKAGQLWYTVCIIAGLLGFVFLVFAVVKGQFTAALSIFVSTFLFCLLAGTLGDILDRLENIAQQNDQLRREMRKNL
jgi:hypothetical protein